MRVGSTYSNTGGTIHTVTRIVVNANYNSNTTDYDVAVLQVCIYFNVSIHNEMCITYRCDNQLYLALPLCNTLPYKVIACHTFWTRNQSFKLIISSNIIEVFCLCKTYWLRRSEGGGKEISYSETSFMNICRTLHITNIMYLPVAKWPYSVYIHKMYYIYRDKILPNSTMQCFVFSLYTDRVTGFWFRLESFKCAKEELFFFKFFLQHFDFYIQSNLFYQQVWTAVNQFNRDQPK